MPATQVLEIKIVSCGGMLDLMSEQEAAFLVNSLGIFRNVADFGRATPRANVSLVRAYTPTDFYRGVAGDDHILHLISHATKTTIQTGNGRSRVTAFDLEKRASAGKLSMPEIVVASGCELQSAKWQSALKAAGVKILIASKQKVTPANLTAFDMAFYAALLSQVRKGRTNVERVEASFELADAYYRSIHARGAKFAKFQMARL